MSAAKSFFRSRGEMGIVAQVRVLPRLVVPAVSCGLQDGLVEEGVTGLRVEARLEEV